MAITSLDILNLSHSLKDICEVNCNTPECLSQALKILMQYNLLRANMEFGRQLEPICPKSACQDASAVFGPAPQTGFPEHCTHDPDPASAHDQAPPTPPSKPPIRLDIADPFLADYEK